MLIASNPGYVAVNLIQTGELFTTFAFMQSWISSFLG